MNMMCRILTILVVLGFSGGISSVQAEQTDSVPNVCKPGGCVVCCEMLTLNATKDPRSNPPISTPAGQPGDAVIAQ